MPPKSPPPAPAPAPKRIPQRVRFAMLTVTLMFLAFLGMMRGPQREQAPSPTSAGGPPAAPADPFRLARALEPRWQDLGEDLGRIAWVETRTDPSVSPPKAAHWMEQPGLWDLKWKQGAANDGGASFGPVGEGAAAWYLIQSAQPSNELWHLDKDSVRITDLSGQALAWGGGSGASRVDDAERLQYLYLLVPKEHAGTGARLTFTVSRFDKPATRSQPVSVRF